LINLESFAPSHEKSSDTEKIDILHDGPAMIIRRKWLGWTVIPLLIFCIVWDSFLFFWYSQVIGGKDTPWIAILFPIGHVCVGIGFTYYVIAMFLNKIDITIAPDHVAVASYPLPWGFRKSIKREDIMAVRVKYQQQNRSQGTYGIRYTDRSNREKSMLRNGLSDDQAEFVVHHLRQTLRLREEG
jgi:hypothetical protein